MTLVLVHYLHFENKCASWEMKCTLKELVYNKHTGELTGFCDMGDINEHPLNLEKSYLEDTTTENTLATKIMVFMVRGLFINLTFPYASFPSSSLTGDQLVPHFTKLL